jgi:hypothetical protein
VNYVFYFENQPIEYHRDYNALFSISPLTIGNYYGNTYVSTVYTSSKNEYRNIIRELSFNTLNESPSGFQKSLVKNKSIDISFLDASGSLEKYTFIIVPSIPQNNIDICMNNHNVTFQDLSINTTYDITIQTEYSPVHTDTSNIYTVSKTYHTLNQSEVSNIEHTIAKGTLSTVTIRFSEAVDFPNVINGYYIVDFSGSVQILSNETTKAIYRDLNVGDYKYTVTSYYPATSSYGENYYTSADKFVSIYNFEKSNVIVQLTQNGTSVKFTKNSNTNHDSYDISMSIMNASTADKPIYIANIRNGIEWNTEYIVSNLRNNREYKYTIFAKYNEDHNTKTYDTSGTFSTINEDAVTIEKLIVRNTSADLSWSSVGSTDISYILRFQNQTTEYSNTQTIRNFQDLSINEIYDISLTVVYKNTNNRYSKHIQFKTLYEEPSTVTADVLYQHPIHGNTIILNIVNRNLSDVSENRIYWDNMVYTTKTQLDISNFEFNQYYFGNVHTLYNYKKMTENDTKNNIQYETKAYITDFSLVSIMIKPITTIYNTSVRLNWMAWDASASYNITLTNEDTQYNTTYSTTDTQYTIHGLEINTKYDISFTRVYNNGSNSQTEYFTIQTLNEGPILNNIDNNIVLNSGLNGRLVVMDISNVNRDNVSENKLFLQNSSYISQDTIIDVDVSYGETYMGNIITTYKPTMSTEVYQLYVTQPYISYDFSFTVGPIVTNHKLIENGKFDLSSSNHTNYHYNFQSTTGTVKQIPPKWYGASIIIADNSNGSLFGHKYLPDNTVLQHVILYNNSQSQIQANLSQNIHQTYFYKNYYHLSFYVANHNRSVPTIEYQIQLLNQEGQHVIYETSPITSNDVSWNKIEIKMDIPKSYKDVYFRIRRNLFESNNLFLSDISFVSLNQEFPLVPKLSFYENTWQLPSSVVKCKWGDIYEYEPITNGKKITLSTNISIEFWLYIHQEDRFEKGIFVLGNTWNSGLPSIYLRRNELTIEHRLHYYEKEHTIKIRCRTQIPIYYQIIYSNGSIIIYENGIQISNTKPFSYLKEAGTNDTIVLGDPVTNNSNSYRNGYIMNNVQIYDFPFTVKQARNRYEMLKANYYTVGNYSTLSPIKMNNSTNIFTMNNSKSYELHNGTILRRQFMVTTMNNQVIDYSLNELKKPFTISFWVQNAYNNILSINYVTSTNTTTKFPIETTTKNYMSFGNIHFPLWIENDSMEHVTCVVDISYVFVYKNGYLYDNSMVSFDDPGIFNTVKLGDGGIIGDLQIYNKALSQSEVFTSYIHYYTSSVIYNLSGVYRVIVYNVDGGDMTSIHYIITQKSSYITYISIPNEGTLNFYNDPVYGVIAYIDMSLNAIELNRFHKEAGKITFSIKDIQMDIVIDGAGNPYILMNSRYNEGQTVNISLINNKNNNQYYYDISGYNIDSGDISGGILSGSIQNYKNIDLRADYKTENLETFIYSIPGLGIAVYTDISDTTQNLLSVNTLKARFEENFEVTLTWPVNSNLPNTISYTTIGDAYVQPLSTGNSFVRNNANTISVSKSFTVTTNEPQKQFIIKLNGYDSSISVILNDFERPRIKIISTSDVNNVFVNETETILVRLETPIFWTGNDSFNYEIIGSNMNKYDISSSSDPTFDFNRLAGVFVLEESGDNRKSDISFVISGNNTINEGDEQFIIKLTDPSFNDISNSINIIDTIVPNIYNLIVLDMNGNSISTINEGETFQVRLNTNDMRDIDYTITGNGINALDLADNIVYGTFTSTNRTKQFTIRNDLTTEGIETMVFTLQLAAPNDNITTSVTINDTSQRPIYSTITTDTDYVSNGGKFNLNFKLLNYDIISMDNRSQNIPYSVTLNGNTQSYQESDVSGSKYGSINFKDISSHTFTYTVLSDISGIFVFTIAEQMKTIYLNNI